MDKLIAAATIITALATTGLLIFAIVQSRILQRSLTESSKARSALVLLEIYHIMKNLRPKWHELYNLPDDFKKWDDSQRTLADYVGTELQNISFLCVKGFVDPQFVMDGYGKVFVQCWDKLEKFIKDYRVQCGEPAELDKGARQRKHFELFAKQCRDFLHDVTSGQNG